MHPIGYGAYHDVSYRITTSVQGLGIRDNRTHFNRAPHNYVETTPFELWFGETTTWVSLNGVVSTELRGALFKVNVVVSNA